MSPFGSLVLGSARSMQKGQAAVPPTGVNLLSAPLDVHGDWGGSLPGAAAAVISRMREACLSGLRLLSDHQPDKLRVDDQASGPPHLWLHEENPTTAWIVVDIGTRAWSQLAYQFGHELGHVMCNSWMWKVETPPPSRWLEECLAEAFSMRGLARLAEGWERDPPFAGDAGYGHALRDYRRDLIEKYQKAGGPEPVQDVCCLVARQSGAARRHDGPGRLRRSGNSGGAETRWSPTRAASRTLAPSIGGRRGAAFRSRITCGCGVTVVRRSKRPEDYPRASKIFSPFAKRATLERRKPRLLPLAD